MRVYPTSHPKNHGANHGANRSQVVCIAIAAMLKRPFQSGFLVFSLVLGAGGGFLVSPVFAARNFPAAAAVPAQTSSTEQSAPTPTSTLAVPLPKGKKLVLKDGTFQIVREYQREGDRVRYYSVERSDWEELPAALVDWDATTKGEADDAARDQELAKKIKATELAARTADINSDRSYEARPGILLPDDAGLYALDGKMVVTMEQNEAVSHLDKGRFAERMVTGVPLIPTKAHIEIPGKRAKIRLHSGDPEFYFRTADGREPAVSLMHVTAVKGDKRELETSTTNVVGQTNYKGDEMPLLIWDAAQSLYRLTVEKELADGEYALVEKGPEGLEMYVWDFGVDTATSKK